MCIVFHFRKEYLLIFLCIFLGIIQQIYIENVKLIKDLKLLFNNLSKFCLIICYFIEKRISKSNIQIKEKFSIKLMLLFICMFIFEGIAFRIKLTLKKSDIEELNLLLQIISYLCIERIIFKNPIYSHHLLSIIICQLVLILILIQYLLDQSLLIILYALLREYCYPFVFLLMKYINTTYFINIYLLASIIGILNICFESFINSSDVKIQSIYLFYYLFYILIMIIYYYCHCNVIKNLGPIHSAIIDTISYCISKLFYHSLHYNDIIYLFLCLFSLLIYLEIIELNFCRLNKNIKIEIEKRGKIETNILLSNTMTYINYDSEF